MSDRAAIPAAFNSESGVPPFEEHEAIDPLSQAEHAEAERVARRLASELRAVIGVLPESERAASAMSRALQLDRATCQRMVAASRQAAGPETLVQMPGVAGLRQVLAAIERRVATPAALEKVVAAQAAVDSFQSLIDHVGGSQRKLKARLEAGGSGSSKSSAAGGADEVSSRQALFRAAAVATGRWSETNISLGAIRPVPGEAGMTESIGLRALIGHHARVDAVPLELGHRSLPQAAPEGEPAGIVLDDFCTRPLPRLISKRSGTVVTYTVDVSPGAEARGADVVIAKQRAVVEKHPATLDPPIGEVWNLINFPARRMVFDVYLHRDIARRCLPSVELHLWAPTSPTHIQSRWSTRFPGGPRLELLGRTDRPVTTAFYPRQADLTAALFGLVGWDASEFVGYRCEAMYPVWRAGYCMSFDFSSTESGASDDAR